MARKSKGALAREQKNLRQDSFAEFMKNDARFKNLTPIQQSAVLTFRLDIVKESERLAEVDGYEKGMIDTLAAVANVLISDYWPKTAGKKVPQFFNDVLSLMDSKLGDVVTFEEEVAYIREHARVNMHCNWMGKTKFPSAKDLWEGSLK